MVNFVIWILFREQKSGRPQHLLCQGYDRAGSTRPDSTESEPDTAIPGVARRFPNEHVQTVKGPKWAKFLSMLGREGELLIADLLLNCAIFAPLSESSGSFMQICGYPLSELAMMRRVVQDVSEKVVTNQTHPATRPPIQLTKPRRLVDIRIVRNRMFYAKPAQSATGTVRLGLRHIHVFNRFSNVENEVETMHIAKYIFPRQFKLHNVFTSTVDSKETIQPFKDYTLRENEITEAQTLSKQHVQLPRRLRRGPIRLVQALRKNHANLPYHALLQYYCSSKVQDLKPGGTHWTSLSIPSSNVSAFIRSVLRRLLPPTSFGAGEEGESNWRVFSRSVNAFLTKRKFETLCLNDIMQGIKISVLPWLRIEELGTHCMSRSDYEKRKELLAELLYYIFDSYIIPIVQS